MFLVAIDPKSSCESAHEWSDDFRKQNMCLGCGALGRILRERAVDVRLEYKLDRSAVNFASNVLIGIIRLDFLALFATEAAGHLSIGKVFDKEGALVPGFGTFLGRKPLPIRGGPESTRRICDVCGRFMYYPLGQHYVMRDSLTGQGVYEGDSASLVVTQELAKRIDRGKWKGIYITELPIRDEPLDGIEKFPERYY